MAEWIERTSKPTHGLVVGGDGAGEAWTVQWTKQNSDGTLSSITSYYYPVDESARGDLVAEDIPKRFSVENQTEYALWADYVGGAEKWTNYTYQNMTGDFFAEDAAAALAKSRALDELNNFETYYSWDGRPR